MTVQYSGLITQLSDMARSVVRDLDPTNDLTFLRVRSKKHEILIAPGKDSKEALNKIFLNKFYLWMAKNIGILKKE